MRVPVKILFLLTIFMILTLISNAQVYGTTVLDLSWSPDGLRIATAHDNGNVRIWNTSGQLLQTIRVHNGLVYTVQWSPDGSQIVTGGDDSIIRIWDVDTALLDSEWNSAHYGGTDFIEWSPSGNYLASLGFNQLLIWDISTQNQIANLGVGTAEGIRWSNEDELFFGTISGLIGYYNVDTSDLTVLIDAATSGVAGIIGLAMSPDNIHGASGGRGGILHLWDRNIPEQSQILAEFETTIYELDFNPDGTLLAVALWDGTVRVLDVETGEIIETYIADGDRVLAVEWSPDGTMIAYVGDETDTDVMDDLHIVPAPTVEMESACG